MASPQVEDGYVRISTELYEAILKFPFSKRELLVVLAVIRKTYGWNKKIDWISLAQLSELTGIDRSHVAKTINHLCDIKVLLKQPHPNKQAIGIQKNYSTWKVLPKQPMWPKRPSSVANSATKCGQNGHSSVAKTATTIDTTTKDNKQKTILQKTGAAAPVVLDGLNLDAWSDYEQHRRDKKLSKLKPQSAAKQQQWLVAQGEHNTQRAIVDETIRNGWQGLFTLKGTGPAEKSTVTRFRENLQNA